MLSNVFDLTILMSTPLVLAAMGGYVSERGGIINIGLEGLMLWAACLYSVIAPGHGPVLALLAGLGGSVALSLLHWLLTQTYRVDHVISGMAINALAAGASNFFFNKYFDPANTGKIPQIGLAVFIGSAVVLPGVLWGYARFTRGGLRLTAVGSDPDRARLAGISPFWVRFRALIGTGIFAGLGGLFLVSYTGVFNDGVTAGRGYIALAALILGGWRPLPTLAGCVAFGFFSALRVQFDGTTLFGLQPPSEFWSALPYLATVVALAGFYGKRRVPGGLGKF